MADVWSIKGITAPERETITKAATAAGLPIGRFIVQACVALDATQPRPEREAEASWLRFERMVRLAADIAGNKDAPSRAARRLLRAGIEAEGGAIFNGPGHIPAPAIEGRATVTPLTIVKGGEP